MTDLKITTPLAPVYVLYGTEAYLLQTLRQQIIQFALARDEQAFDMSTYNMEEQPVELAVEDANTLPFMSEKRVVLLDNCFFLTGDTKKRKVEHHLEQLADYVASPSPDTVMILIAPYEKLDKRKKLVKSLEKEAKVFELNTLTDQMLYQILSDEAQQHSVEYTKAAHNRLLAVSGTNTSILVNEVKKLSLYAEGRQAIDERLVEQLASRTLESDVFAMVDRIMHRDAQGAFRILSDLFQQKEEPVKLLALIMRQFRITFQTDLYQKQGFMQKQIASRLKLHPYAIKIAGEQTKQYGEQALKKALILCSDTDVAIKTGQIDKMVGLQLLIQKLVSL
ncbi:DNA polymerase III subunit delta [Pullulanibacillus camelliae]|uniref:DNA polymerase III subunit delta n=1 Tax=Pullulanibacillus camelliae TaxID=1707096 RepID=A0A8J2YHM6_9BACL|nr:DNA polymerase III subunit delta [Pullulanibacillus camelliae]GGE43464.1 DNA polymerase III subunit delta [Pullulanibacillus camelliae]